MSGLQPWVVSLSRPGDSSLPLPPPPPPPPPPKEIDMLKIQLKEAQERLQHYEGKVSEGLCSLTFNLHPPSVPQSAASSEVSLIDFDASPPAVDTPTSKLNQGVLSPSPTESNKASPLP